MRRFIRRVRGYSRDTRLYLAYTLSANVAIGVFALVFNLYLLELGHEEDFIGLFNALQTLAMAGTAFMLGRLINLFGLWRVVTGGLAIYLAASLLLALITNQVALILLAMLWGGSTALVFTPVMPFVVDLTRPRQRQEVAALTMSLISLSTTIGSLVGGWTPLLLDITVGFERPSAAAFRATMVLGIIIATLALIPLFRMSSERKLARPETSASTDVLNQSVESAPPRDIRWRMIVYVAVGGLMALGGGAVFPFFNVFLASIGASAGVIGIVFAVAWLIAAFIGLWSPWVATKLGTQRGSVLVRLTPVPLFLALILFPVLPVAVLAHLIRVMSINVSWSMESSFISEVLPQRVRYAVFGYRSAAWNVGFSLSSFVAGGIIVRYGYSPSFAAYIIFMTLAMGLYYGYFRSLETAPLPDRDQVEPLAPLPEPTPESEAPDSLPLRPGPGPARAPVIIRSEEPASSQSSPPRVADEG